MEGDAMGGQGPGGGLLGTGCMACGSRDLEVTRPGWVEGVREWLRFGGRWRPSSHRCRRCGRVDSAGSAMYLVNRKGWWPATVRLAAALRRRRTRVPAPATYLLAAAVGAVLGGGAQLALGWPWWLVAAAVLAAVWLLFAASAFRGGGTGGSLATDVLIATDPARAVQRQRRELVEQARAAPFPLYGLPPSWPGPRHLGGSGGRQAVGERPVLTSLSLAHGDPLAGRGPQLRVEVRSDPEALGRVLGGDPELLQHLAEDLWWETEPAAGPPGQAGEHGRPGPGWSGVVIRVEGQPVAFDRLVAGRHWVAVGELDDLTLVLNARDLAVGEVELVRVTDVEPYVEGTRRLDESGGHAFGREDRDRPRGG